jgi:ABC-2 type transport system ATP-binding protein
MAPGSNTAACPGQAATSEDTVSPTTAEHDVVVRVQGFGKRYGAREAVSGVDLVVQRGEIYGLIGPDGAGKSTLMKAIAGVLAHDVGTVEVFGTAVRDERSAERVKARLGFMPQGLGLSLYPELSVEENVDFFAGIRAVSPADLATRKRRLLSLTRLDGFRTRAMKHLSGGMKQKLALVCTLLHEPELVILDEPTTGVDPLSRRDFWAILSELVRERRVAALVSTAYLDEASRCDRVLLLDAGRCLAEDEPESLRRRFTGPKGALDSAEPDLEDVFLELVADRERHPVDERRQRAAPDDTLVRDASVTSSELAIHADGLTRRFGTFVAVEDVSFEIRHGEIVGLLGANGAGKSTVLKMLTGILAPSSGSGRVANMDMRRPGPALRRRIGYMSQAFSLYTDLTVDENITLYAGIYGLDKHETDERRDWIVSLAGLERHLYDLAGALPMGLRQRLALGCALVHRPQMLFLDEPTSGVDPAGRRRFWEILFELARRDGVAMLVTTHALAEAEQCDQVVLMHAGHVVANASPLALKNDVSREIGEVVELGAHDPARLLAAVRRLGIEATPFGRSVHVFCREPERELPALRARLEREQVTLTHAVTKPLTLEDVFVHRIGLLERGARDP